MILIPISIVESKYVILEEVETIKYIFPTFVSNFTNSWEIILIHFRNALRIIIKLSVYDKIDKLLDEENKPAITGDLKIKLIDQKNDLRRALKQSICMCPVCGSTTSDMVFNTYDKYWHCIKCYNENQEFYRKRKEEYRYP
jgi:hypothetical protein